MVFQQCHAVHECNTHDKCQHQKESYIVIHGIFTAFAWCGMSSFIVLMITLNMTTVVIITVVMIMVIIIVIMIMVFQQCHAVHECNTHDKCQHQKESYIVIHGIFTAFAWCGMSSFIVLMITL